MADEIIKVLDALCEKFGIAIDWTSANVMPYLKELCGKYINYEIWTSVGSIVLVSMLFIACLIVAVKTCPKAKENCWYFDDVVDYVAVVSIVAAIIVGIIGLCVACCEIKDIITCLTFPEKMLFEYVQGMLSSSNG